MSDSLPSFIFFDPRYGDTYHVHVEDGEFAFALRYTDSNRPPISYSHLGDIPQPHRAEIRAKLLHLQSS